MRVPARLRLSLAILAAIVLAGLLALDRASHSCLLEGGHFEAMRWTCVPKVPIHIERDIRRS